MAPEVLGRDPERALIQAFLDRPSNGPSALVLEGEAGIGKTTLWLAGVAAARERSLRVLVSRPAETERTLPNVVLGDLFGDVPSELLAALPSPRRRAFETALLVRDAPDEPIDPRALGVSITTLLSWLMDGRPVVIAIDDDQWLDPSSAATIGFALRRLSSERVILLLARRPDGGTGTMLEDAIDPANVERLGVESLSAGAIGQLLRQRHGINLPRPSLLRLHEASGGNPFYALELARSQSMELVGHTNVPLAVPPSLERLVSARLATLPKRSRQALLLIAAHGRPAGDFLRTMRIGSDALEPAFSANVIKATGGVVRFTHPLLAAAAYQGVGAEERRAAHRRLAGLVDDPVDRARHLALGGDEPNDELAATLEAAAGIAQRRGIPIAAAELGVHALRLTPLDAIDDRQRRAIAAGRAYIEAGEGRRAHVLANDLLASAPRGARRAEVLMLLSDVELPARYGALSLLGEALAEAAAVPELRAAIHGRLAEAGRYWKGRTWSERHALASLRLAERLDDSTLRTDALSTLALLRAEAGDPNAFVLAERAYRLASSLSDPRPLGQATCRVGNVLAASGNLEQAREWLERQLAEWTERDEIVRWILVWDLAVVELELGHWDLASEYASQLSQIGVQYGYELAQDQFPPALIAMHRGDFAVARSHSRRGLALVDGHELPYLTAILAICDLWSGKTAAALGHFIRTEQSADIRGWEEPHLRWWRAEYVEALLEVGRIDDAVRLVDDWEARAHRVGRRRVLAQTIRCRGLIAAARGELSTAQEFLAEAAARHGTVGDAFGRARAHLALGVVRRRARQKRSARAELEAALADFEALGAASWAAKARAELARIGGHARIEGLSPSELRVAELVAEGRTNREVAATLFLGERTVASHLTHAYAKLGVRSRTELARVLHTSTEPASAYPGNIPTS